MPTYITGNLWAERDRADLLLVTTNGTINHLGRLVMGRGAARELAEQQPDFPSLAALHLSGPFYAYGVVSSFYGVRCIRQKGATMYGIFQVKTHWRDAANLQFIAWGAGYLCALARDYKRIAMNFPGIGNGRLARESVIPFLDLLPAHVYIYEHA